MDSLNFIKIAFSTREAAWNRGQRMSTDPGRVGLNIASAPVPWHSPPNLGFSFCESGIRDGIDGRLSDMMSGNRKP